MPKKVATLLLIFFTALIPLGTVAETNTIPKEPTINEIYPNPPQSPETGYEFIELFNPNDVALTVSGYSLRLKGKTGTLALIGEIPARSFKAYVTPFSLTNSGATVQLYTPASPPTLPEVIIEEVAYTEVADDKQSWSRYDIEWKQMPATPNLANSPLPVPVPEPTPAPIEYLRIEITELLPDPMSPLTDSDHEFIELYNPNETEVNLAGYKLKSGTELDDEYILPAISVQPKQFIALYVSESKLGLINSTSRAALFDPNNTLVSEAPAYVDPFEGASWAFVNGVWQHTFQPTPGTGNVYLGPPDQTEPVTESNAAASLQPCDAGEERNPHTNRCRSIASASIAALTPCAAGEERNPATNRCRKVASTIASLTACGAGEERNPDTNRCRKIAAASTQKPCDAGEERNPQTNRCRKTTASTVGSSKSNGSGSDQQSDKPKFMNFPSQWLIAIVGVGAVAYGVYEWRGEIGGLASRFGNRVLRRTA